MLKVGEKAEHAKTHAVGTITGSMTDPDGFTKYKFTCGSCQALTGWYDYRDLLPIKDRNK